MMSRARDFALNQNYHNDLATLSTKLRDSGSPASSPFMQTPVDLVKHGWNDAPALSLSSSSSYRDILDGGDQGDMAMAKLTMGSLVGHFLFDLAQQGLITGGAPADGDPSLDNGEPYSVKTPDGWAPIAEENPETTLPGMVADYAGIHNNLDWYAAERAAMAFALAFGQKMVDNDHWGMLSDLVDRMSGADKANPQDYLLPLSSAAPQGGNSQNENGGADPLQLAANDKGGIAEAPTMSAPSSVIVPGGQYPRMGKILTGIDDNAAVMNDEKSNTAPNEEKQPVPEDSATNKPNPGINNDGRNFIIDQEMQGHPPALRRGPDPHKNPTIGYGHKILRGENIREPLDIEGAQQLFEKDLRERVNPYLKMVKVPLSQDQINALADFIFNRGNVAFTTKILPELNAGHYDKIPDIITSEVGDNLPGNVRRRRAEADLFAGKPAARR